ncbi:MAG: rubrerythrin family protein [Spirochaetaceae bacterium]
MSKSIKGSRTEQNLLKAFAGESQARNRYTYFAGVAKKEGLVQISFIFEETANQEKEHAKRFFKFLEGGDLEITATYPAGKIGSTLENLKAAAAGEKEEWMEIYPEFATVAREEGFLQVAAAFDAISVAEKQHGKRYTDLATNLEEGKVFKRNGVVVWRCLNCGFLHESEVAPNVCAACLHPQSYFELLSENW